MPKSCFNCLKYPMCNLFNGVDVVINESCCIKDSYTVFISLASHCKYYKEDIEED